MSAEKGLGRLVNQLELATLMGVSPLTIKAWERKGCPIEQQGGRGRASQYNTAAVIRWREKMIAESATDHQAMDLEDAKTRKMAAEALTAEMNLDVMRGKLVEIDKVGNVIEAEYSTIRANFMSFPGEIAADLEHRTALEIEELLTSKVSEILSALAADDKFAADEGEG